MSIRKIDQSINNFLQALYNLFYDYMFNFCKQVWGAVIVFVALILTIILAVLPISPVNKLRAWVMTKGFDLF